MEIDHKVLSEKVKLCIRCSQIHNVQEVEVEEEELVKGVKIRYKANYSYCKPANCYLATGKQFDQNMKNAREAYWKEVGKGEKK